MLGERGSESSHVRWCVGALQKVNSFMIKLSALLSFTVIKITNKYSSTRWVNGTMLNVKKEIAWLDLQLQQIARQLHLQKPCKRWKDTKLVNQRFFKTYQTNHKSHTWFSTALLLLYRPSLLSFYFAAVVLAAALPPLAIYRQRVSWYNLLKRKLVTHLGDTAQSNNIASKFGDPRGSDPPSNSCHHPKRQNLHPHWYQCNFRAWVLIKCDLDLEVHN